MNTPKHFLSLLALPLLIAGAPHALQGATFGWSGSGAGPGTGTGTAWLTSGNWTNNSTPSTNDLVFFGLGGTGAPIGINFNGINVSNTYVGGIVLGGGSTADRIVGNSSTTLGGTLNLAGDNGGVSNLVSGRILTLAPYGGGRTFPMTLTLLSNVTFNAAAGASNVVTAALLGTGNLTNTGSGQLALLTNNTHTGKFIAAGGTLLITNETALGANPASYTADQFTFNGGTLRITNNSPVLISNANRGITLTGAGTLQTETNVILAVPVVGTGALTKTGTTNSILSLTTNNNTFSGNITVSFGGINVKNSTSLGVGPKSVTINNGSAGMTHMILDTNGTLGAAADINLPSNISFNTSFNVGTVTNTSGNNIIQGTITMTSGGGDTLIAANGGTLTLRGAIAPNTTARALRLGGTGTGTNTVSAPISGSGANAVLLAKQDSGTWTLTGTNSHTSSTFILGGTLIISGSGSVSNSPLLLVSNTTTLNVSGVTGGFTVETNQTLTGGGTVIGAITFKNGSTNASSGLFIGAVTANSGARIQPGGLFAPATLVISNGLTMNGCVLSFDLAGNALANTGSNDLIVVNGNVNIPGPVQINFSFPLGGPALGVPYTLVRYSGTLSGGANLSVANLSSGVTATIDTSIPGYITVTFAAAAPNTIVWTGTNGFNWDFATTANFSNAAGAAVVFNQLDNVLFDDSSTNPAVTLVGVNLQPTTTTVNSSSNYTFSGSGALAGGSLAKSGSGILTLNTTNTYAGQTLINGGTLKLGVIGALGATNGPGLAADTVIGSSGTLDLNANVTDPINETITVSGAGAGGFGAIINSGAGGANKGLRGTLTLTGDTTFGASNRWDIIGARVFGNGFRATKLGAAEMFMSGLGDTGFGDVDVQAGLFTWGGNSTPGDPTRTYNIGTGAILNFFGHTVPFNKVITAQNGAFIQNGSGNAFISGPITLSGAVTCNLANPVIISNVIGGAGVLVKSGVSTLTLVGPQTYGGGTLIVAGQLQGTTDSLQGNITNNSGIAVNQSFDGALNATISGSGSFLKRGLGKATITIPMSITGTVTNEAGSIVLGADNVLGFGLQDWRGASSLFPAFESSDMTTRTITNAISISTDARLGSATSGNLVFSGPINNGGGNKVLTISNAMTTFSSGLLGIGVIIKQGPGQLVLGSSNNNGGLIISNGLVTLSAGALFQNNPHLTNLPGAVLDVSAGVGGAFNLGSARNLVAGRSSGFANDIIGSLSTTGTVIVAFSNNPGTLTLSGDLSATGGAAFSFDLANANTTGAGVNDFINCGGTITLGGTIALNVNLLNGSLANGVYTLMTGTAPVAGAPTFTLTGTNGITRQNVAAAISGNSVVLNVTGTPVAGGLTWLGTNVNWDLTTTNWWSGSLTDRFFNGDSVVFDNSSTNTNVVITATVLPGTVTVNSSSNYVFSGAGVLGGGATLVKSGTGTLSLGNANTFIGPVTITDGTIKQANAGALGNTLGVNISAGGGFDFAGFTTTSKSLGFTIAGTGADGFGAIKNTGTSVSGSALSNVTLTADATIGSHGTDSPSFGRMDIGQGYGLLNGNGNKLTKIGPGYLDVRSTTINLPEIIVTGGTLYSENFDNNLGTKVTVASGARLGGTGLRTYTNQVDLANGSIFFTAVAATASTWTGPINAPSGTVFIGNPTISAGAGAQDLRITSPLNGAANLFVTTHPLELSANNDATFSGNISVVNTTLRLTNNGTHGSGVITNVNGNVDFNLANDYSYLRTIYGTNGTVTKSGTNRFLLAAGPDQISDGLVLNVLGGTFDLNGRSEGLRGVTGNAGTLLTNSAGLVTLTLTNPLGTHTYNGAIGGAITVVIRDSSTRNSNLESFTGTNLFTGGLVLDNGQLRVNGDGALGAVPLSYDPANIIFRNNGTLQNNAATVFLHPNRGVVLESDGLFMVGFSVGNDIVVSGSITGPGRLLKGDGQKLILKNANTFTGDTVFTNAAGVGQGTIRLDHTYALQNSTFDATGLGGNGTLDLNNMDIVVGMLKGSGATIANFNGRLTAGGNSQNGVFGSTLSGAGNLVKVGPGVLVLTAANNPYNGGTIVSNGALINLGNLSGAGAITVKSGAILGGSGSFAGPVTAEPGGSVYPGASAGTMTISNHAAFSSATLFFELASVANIGGGINDLIDVKTNLTLSGTTLVRFSFPNGVPALGVPYTLITYGGTLSGGAGNLASVSRYTATFDTSVAGQVRVTFTGTASNLVWAGSTTNNTWNLDTFTNFFNGVGLSTFKDGDSVTFDGTGYAGAPVNVEGLVAPPAFTINAAQDYTFGGLGRISSPNGLTKLGSGKATFTGSNDIAGPLTINAGTVAIGADDNISLPPVVAFNQLMLAGGTLQTFGSFTLNSNRRIAVGPTNGAGTGTIDVTGTNLLITGGIIGNNQFGIGTLVKSGPGSLALSAANLHVGGTIVRRGTLLVRNDFALGNFGAVTMGDAGTGTDSATLLLDTVGSGANRALGRDIIVSSAGSGVATIGSTPSPLAPGALQAQFNGSLVLSNHDVVLQTGAGDFTRFSGEIRGVGNVIIANGSLTGDTRGNGGNRLIFNSVPKTFIGDITIQSGTANPLVTNFTVLQIDASHILPDTVNVTIQNNAVLRFNTPEEAINNIFGEGRIRAVGARTLTVGAANGSSVFNGTIENDPYDGGGTLAITKTGSGMLTLTGTNTYTGATIVSGGTLAFGPNGSASNSPSFTVAAGATLNGSAIAGGLTLMGAQTLSCAGTVTGSLNVASNATVNPGLLNVVGTMAVSGNVTFNTSNRLNFELGATTTIGSGVNDLIDITGDLTLTGTSYVTVSAAGPLAAGTYTLVRCTGAKTGGAANLILVNNTASAMTLGETANTITLTVATAGRSLVWSANFTNSLWDINTTTNWFTGGMLDKFLAGDAVLFDSTASNATVTLNVTALPSTVTLTGLTNYTFTGSGKIGGAASITQNSTSTNTISLANDFSGTITINSGVLKAGNTAALSNLVGSTFVNSGGTLDANGLSLGAENFVVAGAGFQGQGALVNNGASQTTAFRFVTLAGDTTFGGVGRWDIRGGPTASLLSGGQPYKISKIGPNQVSLVDVQTVDAALGDIDVLGGIFSIEVGTISAGDPSRFIRIGSTGALQFFNLAYPLNKAIAITNGGQIINNSGINAIVGPVTLLGSNFFNVGGTTLTLSNAVTGAGTLWKGGANNLVLAGNNSYSGGAVVQAGTVTIAGNEPNSGGYSNGATLALGNVGYSGSIGGLITNNGTLNFQRLDASTFSAGVVGLGTINQVSGSGPVTLSGGISNATLRPLSGNASPLTLDAGSYAFNSISVGANPSGWMNILPGANVFANSLFLGDASTMTGYVAQVGGTVLVTNQFRLGHFPNNVSTYLLGGGSFTLTTASATSPYSSGVAEVNGGFYIGIDGVGIFTQTGGVLNVPGIVLDNRGATTLGIATNTYNLVGGTVNLGQWGFLTGNSTYQINLGGGTVASSINWTSTLALRLTGTGGDVTFNPGAFNNFLFGVLSGPGGLRKLGGGSLILSNASTFAGNTLISGGTLALIGPGGLAGSANIIVEGGAVLDASAKTGGLILGPAQTLRGNGTVRGLVTINGVVAPGASIGTLTFDSALTLAGTTMMEIDRAAGQTSDLIVAPSVAYGGTLTVTNTGGTLLLGDTFNLFDASTFSSSFTVFVLPALTAGLGWDVTQLGVDGTIRVVELPMITTPPANQIVECASGTAMFSVTATGTVPLSYQWRSNGVAVAGATASTLSFGSLNIASSGNFDVVVANAGGSVTSVVATLATVDTTPPTAICSTNILAECTSSNGAAVTFIASATDTCDPAPALACAPASGSTFALGSSVVTCTATDASGNTNACTFTVTVTDSTPPMILTCATNRSLSANPSCQVAIPNLTSELVATDLCGVVTITQSPAAGTLVGLGATNVTLTVSDPASNTVTCVALLTVIDTTPPTLTCPANLVVQCDSNVPPADFAGGTASDNCNPAPVVTHVGDVTTGTCPKMIVRTYRATDASGNTNDCAQTIIVHDNIPPMIVCPANVAAQCAAPAPNFAGGTASDNCDPAPVVTHVSDVSVGMNPTTITRTYRATDACGNTNDCTQTITVQDTIAPVISMCAPDVTLTADGNSMALIPNLVPQVVAADNCSGVTTTQNPAAGTSVGASNTPVVLTVTDAVGNSSTCTAIVSVVTGTVAPSITTQPMDVTAECSSNATFMVVANGSAPLMYQWYFGTNLLASATNSALIVVASPATAGSYSVIVSNVAGTVTSSNAVLRVIDTKAPVLTCPPPVTVQCLANVPPPNFAGGSVFDACDPNPVVTHLSDVTNGICPATVTRRYRAVDISNNVSTCAQIITVQDTVPPTINCGQNEFLQCGLSWGFTVPIVNDNCDPAPALTIVSTTTNVTCGNAFVATRVWQVTDFCNNITLCTQVVTVVDTTPPMITQCPGPVTVQCLSHVPAPDTGLVTAFDTCNAFTVTWAGDVTNGTCPKTITRTYRATDACSNSAPCVQIITVHDTTPPTLTCPPGTNVQCDANVPPVNVLSVSAADNCDPAPVVTHVSDAASGSCPKTIVRTYRATDACGNTNDCAQVITVHDTIAPTITCPTPVALKTSNPLGTNVSFSASATDNCGTITPVCTPPSGAIFSPGITTVNCVATDACGNSNTCSFTVTITLSDRITRTVNQPVPDGSSVGLASVLNIASPIGNLTDVNVTLNLSNGWNGDLYAYLVHDSGFTVLLNRTGKRAADAFGYNDPGFNVTFDDQAAQEIHSYRLHVTGSHTVPLGGPLTGSWKPDGRLIDPAVVLDTDARTEFLSSFNGLNPNGEWVLYVGDEVTGDVSTLVNWSLELCGDAGVAPVITGQPQGQTVACGTPVTLSVTNTGSAPVGYHWRANGVPVPGANTATLSIPSAHNRLPVAYSVIVSNAFGSVTSAVATVTVTDVAPVINTQPASRTNLVGTTATFTVVITSCSDAAFQWCKGVTPISGATNATLTLANVQLSDAGGYLVKITNAGGTVTSATATLTVNRAPIALPNGGATIQGQALPISLIKLLSNDSDPDGDAITVTAVTATSTNGGSVMLAGGYVTYTPLPAFTGLDRYSYTISDGRGGTATTNVEILVVSKDLPSANQVVIIPVGAGFLIRFAGIPGVTYRLQRAPAVNGPWTTLATTMAPLHGIIDYLDATPPPGAGFYRTVSP